MKKILISLAVLLTVVLIPLSSSSKTIGPEIITLTGSNLLVLNSQVNGESVGAIIVKAKELDAKLSGRLGTDHTTPMYLYLNSPGGSIQSGLELIEALKGMGRPVHTVITFAASMAWQISQNLNTRYILKSGILMSHHASGQFQGAFGGASPSQLDSRVRLWTQITKELDETTVARTNGKQTLESYQKAYNPELWITGQESVEQGYADSVVQIKCGDGLSGTTQHSTEFLGLQIQYELDACPINTAPMNIHVGAVPGMTNEYIAMVKSQFLSRYEMKASTPLPMVF